ncbi:hypothetical protein HDU87_001025 [Geranomyces variabilis]|uniref:DUF5672 domain-containing protein n=1 Tax=Geranomyces variabilis TaxID=109894 RepID=A0AAD5TPU7_9FUNG|nr:hypothetical protein HDU87_001025 [Geranomyces variabilis]
MSLLAKLLSSESKGQRALAVAFVFTLVVTGAYCYESVLAIMASQEHLRPSHASEAAACASRYTSVLNKTKIALLIELRPERTLIPILLHYMATVPEDWPFMLMHSAEVVPLLNRSSAVKKYITSGKLTAMQLPETIKLKDRQDVSYFLTQNSTWHLLPEPAEHIFFFQLDAMICSNSEQSVDDYLHFDYIGAPWPHAPQLRGGNGGFSMRRKSRLLRCLRHRTWHRGEDSEDVFYSYCLSSFPDAVMPSFNQQKEFAIERVDSPRYLGLHKPAGGVKVATHLDFCPEAAMLFRA